MNTEIQDITKEPNKHLEVKNTSGNEEFTVWA